MPNIFTPVVSPTLNDCFAPIGLEDCYDMLIYNRWGNLIFDSRELNKKCWDGRVWKSDQVASEGVYFYIVDALGKTLHGTVTLVR
ncbi:MAG: gliding motility-associated C-terminal domain-containing protein [Flavobacteriales bacterium]|nr:gliding motility-associated C-terminal domain-containing protein [Flavobacteriales bacterium]MCX7768439.1 gliding motility-associated C-terminal domain-containing protein [Flavobacteriales bacterium]